MKKTKHQELQKLVDSGINLSSLGLELCDMTEDERYFCTPERAEVFGRVGAWGLAVLSGTCRSYAHSFFASASSVSASVTLSGMMCHCPFLSFHSARINCRVMVGW